MKFDNVIGDWAGPLSDFLNSNKFKSIGKQLKAEIDGGMPVMPQQSWQIFEAFKLCTWEKVKVVILTNNPYTGYETDGLAFSAQGSHTGPTAVQKVIFQAIQEDLGIDLPVVHRPGLGRWAMQGVLLLNCDITSVRDKRGAHVELWRPFIEHVIKTLNEKVGVFFVLIGKEAQKYKNLISNSSVVRCLEHPMQSIAEKREWKHEDIFTTINTYTNFMFDKKINWI